MKQWICTLVAGALMAASLCGCGTTDPDSSTGGTTTTTAAKPKLVMATNATFPPYEFYDGDQIVGIDAEIAAKIAEKLGMELVIEDMEFNSIIPSVNADGADMGMAGMTVDETRLKQVDFSTSYAKGVQVVIVKEDSPIQTPDDLAGKKIGVQLATTGDIFATDDFGADFVTQYNKATDAVVGLKGGDVDAVIIDNEPAKVFVKQNPGLKILDTTYADEDYAICVKKGNTELLTKINAALAELTADGTIQQIVNKYIPAE